MSSTISKDEGSEMGGPDGDEMFVCALAMAPNTPSFF